MTKHTLTKDFTMETVMTLGTKKKDLSKLNIKSFFVQYKKLQHLIVLEEFIPENNLIISLELTRLI